MKTDKKLSVLGMAIQNLKAKKFRTAFMMSFVMLMSATFFFSTLLMNNLKLGIKNTTERMGADMIVVPREGTENIRESLFAGKPCTVVFDREWEEKVRNVEGVKRVSPQLYLATLSASCCDASVQLIAFDPKTDFVVTPWLKNADKLALEKGEVVVGNHVTAEAGDTIRFYETEFKVVEKLEKTGMGYDNSVFMTYETSYMLKESEKAQQNLPTEKMQDEVSMLMVDIEDGIEGIELGSLQVVIQKSNDNGEQTRAFTADELMSGIAEQVDKLSGYGNILTYIMVISTALALISIFVITINERKYEFGILYTLGAKKKHITNIILSEALLISIVGGMAGVLVSAWGVIIFKEVISMKLDIPYFDSSLGQVLPVAVTCIVIAVVTGIIAAACSSYRISKGETYHLIRESE